MISALKNFKIFDSHFHIIDRRFPLVPNQGYLPDNFTCGDTLRITLFINANGDLDVNGFSAQ